MKIESVSYNDTHSTFAASFDDGITIILTDKLQYQNMISTGLDSYFMTKGKWPTRASINKRVTLSTQWIHKNKNRYKKWQPAHDHNIIEE
jgi:hypothetical protein